MCFSHQLAQTQSAFTDSDKGGTGLNHHQCVAPIWAMQRQPFCARMFTTHQLRGIGRERLTASKIGGGFGGRLGEPGREFSQDSGEPLPS